METSRSIRLSAGNSEVLTEPRPRCCRRMIGNLSRVQSGDVFGERGVAGRGDGAAGGLEQVGVGMAAGLTLQKGRTNRTSAATPGQDG